VAIVEDYSPIYTGDLSIYAPQFLHKDQTPVDLSGCTITMKMELLTDISSGVAVGTIKTCDVSGSNAFVINDATNGKAHRRWTTADTNTSGIWGLWETIIDASGNSVHADDGQGGPKKLMILPAH
jgi:hypothetical protein